jgi:hypothetical protein
MGFGPIERQMMLFYTWGTPQPAPARPVLHAFLNLAKAGDQAILKFAQKHGVLGLCAEHNRPHAGCAEIIAEQNRTSWRPWSRTLGAEQNKTMWFAEPVAFWRLWSRILGAALEIAKALSDNRKGSRADWELVSPPAAAHDVPRLRKIAKLQPDQKTVAEQSRILGRTITEWLDWTKVGLVVVQDRRGPHRGGWSAQFGSRTPANLFGRAVLEMLNEISNAGTPQTLVRCANPDCGKWNERARRPRPGENSWCEEDECRRARDRAAARRKRAGIATPTPNRGKRSGPRRRYS